MGTLFRHTPNLTFPTVIGRMCWRLGRWATWPIRKLDEACDLCDRR